MSHENTVLTAPPPIVALNPRFSLSYPSNGRSFRARTDHKTGNTSLELWRGVYLSVRPRLEEMLVTVDTPSDGRSVCTRTDREIKNFGLEL
ncbi:hypothetical protein K438DRAFT_1839412, partial [Mycena galopus ATCC 62051]